jgi:hypothetical protein
LAVRLLEFRRVPTCDVRGLTRAFALRLTDCGMADSKVVAPVGDGVAGRLTG